MDTKLLNEDTVYINALYAKETNYLDYSEVANYRIILYQMLVQEYKYILYGEELPNIFEIKGRTFIKDLEGILCFEPLDEEFVESVNASYEEKYQQIIRLSREKFKESNKIKIK